MNVQQMMEDHLQKGLLTIEEKEREGDHYYIISSSDPAYFYKISLKPNASYMFYHGTRINYNVHYASKMFVFCRRFQEMDKAARELVFLKNSSVSKYQKQDQD
jgi:hypothetical protein